jgi:oligoribonuclease (3'-5' exoribonuclease)
MTGLDPTRDLLLEVGCIVTDAHLHELERLPVDGGVIGRAHTVPVRVERTSDGPARTVIDGNIVSAAAASAGSPPRLSREHALDPRMSAHVLSMHTANGLLERVARSQWTYSAVEDALLALVARHAVSGQCLFAGSSVAIDRAFLARFMPRLVSYTHYRIVDVSSVMELGARWLPREMAGRPLKKRTHNALSDIEESIEELRYYRKHLFRAPDGYTVPTPPRVQT